MDEETEETEETEQEGEKVTFYQYESEGATLIISAEKQDDADIKLVELVREPNIFDCTGRGE